jgi:hypothetical protein
MVPHEKVFNKVICTQDCLSLDFFHKNFYKGDNKDIYYIDCVSPKLS